MTSEQQVFEFSDRFIAALNGGDPATVRTFYTRDATCWHNFDDVDQTRVVGGAVRNSLMGLAVGDIDLATTLLPEEVSGRAAAKGIKAVPTGIEHGTVTGVSGKRPSEITTLRRDVSTDGRNATVAFTDDWAEDAGRRDFRLNALYADRSGAIFDPTGEGAEDAREGRIVFVGDPETRIREDFLRILRFFRFHAIGSRPGPEVRLARAARHWRGIPGRKAVSRTRPVVLDRVRSGTGLLLDVRRPPRMRRPQGFSGPQAHLPAGSAAPGPGTAPAASGPAAGPRARAGRQRPANV